MLSIDEAVALILATAAPLPAEAVAVEDALGRVLAEDVVAAHDVPPFANSAMDGFAVRSADGDAPRRVVGESRAGAPASAPVGADEAIAISTGAAMPDGADAVVPIERVELRDDTIAIAGGIGVGAYVRLPAEDLRRGDLVLPRGTRLGASELGAAIAAGGALLSCARAPRVAVVGTGDELVPPGSPLERGQIHDSNAIVLSAIARADGAHVVSRRHAADEPAAIRAVLDEALATADVVLVSGGVSVGRHDHVKPTLEALGVREQLWGVALRPGKPTWFGTRGATLVFGLPGNPVSSLVTYVLFARPAIAALQGVSPWPRRAARLADARRPLPDRDEAVRVHLDETDRAHVTGPQGSHVLSSMLGADALALIPRGEDELPAGATVEVEPLATFG